MKHIIPILPCQPLPPRPRSSHLANQIRVLQRPHPVIIATTRRDAAAPATPHLLVHPLQDPGRVPQEPLAAGHGGLGPPAGDAVVGRVRVDGAPRGDAEGAQRGQVRRRVAAAARGGDRRQAGRAHVRRVGGEQARDAAAVGSPAARPGSGGGGPARRGCVVGAVAVFWR